MQRIPHWTPALFCAALSVITVIAGIATYGSPMLSVIIPFFCFLPMSFFFVGSVTSGLRKENADLLEQLNQLRRAVDSKSTAA